MVVDVVIVVVVVLLALRGWYQGLVRSIWGYTGLLLGAAVGVVLVPLLLGALPLSVWLSFAALAVVLVCAGGGRRLALRVQRRVSAAHGWTPPARVDRPAGAVFGAVATLAACWMLGFALAGSSLPTLAAAVNRSEILGLLDRAHLPVSSFLLGRFEALGDRRDFPRYVDVFTEERVVPVPAPPADVVSDPDVVASAKSVHKILTRDDAVTGSEGSGFVVGPRLLMTAAHVVDEAEEIGVRVGGRTLAAEVAACDTEHDVAVLTVRGLSGRVLSFTDGRADEPAVLVGYPADGPLSLGSARIREQREWQSADSRGDGRYVHDAYVVRGTVRGGNSGGPLVATDGRVLGVVVASSRTDPDTGYVLTRDQVAPVLAAATSASAEGSCAGSPAPDAAR